MLDLNVLSDPTISIPMDPLLLSALNLSTSGASDSDPDNNLELEPAEDGNKISSLLKAALEVSAYHFPLLNEESWQVLLNLFQPSPFQPRELVMVQMAKSGFVNRLLADVRIDYSTEDQKAIDFERLENLDMAECLAIMLVADRLWSVEHNAVKKLRTILSKVSGRPEECVFSNDPMAEELWTVRNVDMPEKLSGLVNFDYAGHPMATLEFTVSPDLSTISSTGYEVLEARPLVLPGDDVRTILFSKAMPKIDEVLQKA